MRKIRVPKMKVAQVRQVLEDGPVILVYGRTRDARLIMLPAEDWDEVIASVYQPGSAIVVGRLAVTESLAMRLLRDQVDENLQPWAYGVLTASSWVDGEYIKAPVAFLVPDTLWWKKRIAAEIKRRAEADNA